MSQRFATSSAELNARGADDFTVPDGATWTIDEVDAVGRYATSGHAAAETVWLYEDAGGRPGTVLARVNHVGESGDGMGSFVLSLGTAPVTLAPGHYWLSVRATGTRGENPFWLWLTSRSLHGSSATWRNPPDGFGTGCTTFTALHKCATARGLGPDFLFTLRGTSTP